MTEKKSSLFTHFFTSHPQSVGESYLQHFRFASLCGFKLVLAGLAGITHSIFPFLFVHTASNLIQEIHQDLTSRRRQVEY